MACASVSRVLFRRKADSVIYLGQRSRAASIDLPAGNGRAARCPTLRWDFPAYLVFQPVGFAKPLCRHNAGGLLPRLFTLAVPCFHRGLGGLLFCGTVRSATVTGSAPSR